MLHNIKKLYYHAMTQTTMIKVFSLMLIILSISWAASPYRASWELDVPLGVGAGAIFGFGQYRINKMEFDEQPYDRNKLLPWDRPFAGTWNPNAALASDILIGYAAVPLVLGSVAWQNGTINGGDFATQALMLYEVLALQNGLALTIRSTQLWPRPYMLGPHGEKEGKDAEATGSFLSAHTSAAFSLAVFTGVWFDDVYPDSR